MELKCKLFIESRATLRKSIEHSFLLKKTVYQDNPTKLLQAKNEFEKEMHQIDEEIKAKKVNISSRSMSY